MESQPNYEVSPNSNKQRSLPIPKQVNFFILANYGDAYYQSTNSSEKQEILKNIENQCIQSGYKNIRAQEIERRFKNMKSHYRRKKLELELGTVPLVVWEYFGILDRIFKNIQEKTDQPFQANSAIQKRAATEEVKKEEMNVEHSPDPQDL